MRSSPAAARDPVGGLRAGEDVVAGAAVDVIGAEAALDLVVAVVAVDLVVAVAAVDLVVAGSAADDVVAVLAVDVVVTAEAVDGVVVLLAEHGVDAVGAEQRVGAEAAVDERPERLVHRLLGRDRDDGLALVELIAVGRRVLDVHRVVAEAAEDEVGGAVGDADRVVAAAAEHLVFAGTAREHVVAVGAGEAVVVASAFQPVVAVLAVDRVAVGLAIDRVVAVLAEQPVAGAAAVEDVVVIAAIEPVGAVAAVELVVARAADDLALGAAAAVDDVVPGPAVEQDVAAQPGFADDVVALAAVERVVGVAAVDAIVARAAIDHVVAEAAVQEVVARAAVQLVDAGRAVPHVVALAAVERVVAARGHERVVAGAAVEHVVPPQPAQDVVAAEPDQPVVASRAVQDLSKIGAGEQREPGLDHQRARAGQGHRAQELAADRGEDGDRPAARVADVEPHAVGRVRGVPRPVAGRGAGEHAPPGQVDERGPPVPASQVGARRHDRLGALRPDADAAAAVGPEVDRAGHDSVRRCDAHEPRVRPALALARRRRRHPRLTGRRDAHARGAGEVEPAHEPPRREVEHRHLAAGLDHDGARRRDRQIERRAGQLAAADPLRGRRIDEVDRAVARGEHARPVGRDGHRERHASQRSRCRRPCACRGRSS